MRLYKAIYYDKTYDKKMSSEFKGEYLEHSCFEDIIKTAFKHVSHGDKKNEKDYWISFTKEIHTALQFLNNKKYNYNGIAIIDLPETNETGYIYDETLREKGYICKEIINNNAVQRWQPNKDGVILSLDMSSAFTINYLVSYLWLKGNKNTLRNIRANLYACSKDEVLILGENIPFEFYSKREIMEMNLLSKEKQKVNIINNYHEELYFDFIELAPESDFKDKVIRELSNKVKIDKSKYKDYDYHEMQEKRREIVVNFYYKNTQYTFNKEIAKKAFYESYKSSYENRDNIDYSDNEFITRYNDFCNIFDAYLHAFVRSGTYIQLILDGKLNKRDYIWKTVNLLYKDKFVENNEINSADEFINKRWNRVGFGMFPNNKPIKYNVNIDNDDLYSEPF